MEKTKKSIPEVLVAFMDKSFLWVGFLFLQVLIITCLCSPFAEHDLANQIAWGIAPVVTIICAVKKSVRDLVIMIAIILMILIGIVAFFQLLGGIAYVYGIGNGR